MENLMESQRVEQSAIDLLTSKAFVNKTRRNKQQIMSCINQLKRYQESGDSFDLYKCEPGASFGQNQELID